MDSFEIIVDQHRVKITRLEPDQFRVSMADIDLGNLSRSMSNGQSEWASTTHLKSELVEKMGVLIDQFYRE